MKSPLRPAVLALLSLGTGLLPLIAQPASRSPAAPSLGLVQPASAPIAASAPTATTDSTLWPAITQTAKPWARWWWLGSAVDKENLTRELEAFAAAGFGGVEITPIYGAKGYEDRFIPFLSPEYLEMLAHVGAEAKRLGLGVDMATGTGWPFGGPQVTPADAELRLAFAPDGSIAPRPSNFKVKRSAPGGEGLVLNPYSTDALSRYLAPFSDALAKLPPGTLRAQFHDSFEYTANWANELPARFEAMHGYKLTDHAAALAGNGDPDTVARIKADYRVTLGEMHLDYVRAWTAWAHARGMITRNQAHGSPGNLLDLYAAADIPETEIFGSIPFPIPGFRREPGEIGRPGHPPIIHRFASSAAHVTGKRLVSAETFTWLREHFHESPSEMKPELDELFLAGINHVFYHGTAYSPADAPWPGWLFYASSQLNTRNPLWRDLGDGLNAYIARCQSLLQLGEPDNDVLVYWPYHDLLHDPKGAQIQLTVHADWLGESPTGKLMNELVARRAGFDLISDAQLQLATYENERIKVPGGLYSSNIYVPHTEHMPLETLQRLLSLADSGAFVRFFDKLPGDVPGNLEAYKRRKALLSSLEGLAWEKSSIWASAKFGKGSLVVVEDHERQLGLGDGWKFKSLKRKLPNGKIHFIVNNSPERLDSWVPFRTQGSKSAAIMDARSGVMRVAPFKETEGDWGGDFVYLQLEPGESIFVRTYTDRIIAGPKWECWRDAGPATQLTGAWRVTFLPGGGPETPPAFTAPSLTSWTDQGGEAERFAGTARYETEFTLPAPAAADSSHAPATGSTATAGAGAATATPDDWRLDLGDVRETARVFVNGREVDLLWSLPFRTRIGAFLKPGKNTLAIEVTNLAANRIRDLDRRKVAWKNFHEINFVNIDYKPFDASGWPLQPSGLLGPVTLTPLSSFTPER